MWLCIMGKKTLPFCYFKLDAWSYHYVVWWETATNCCFHLLNIPGPSCPSSVIAFLNWRVLLCSIFLHMDVLLPLWYFFFLGLFCMWFISSSAFKSCFRSRCSRDLLGHCCNAANESPYAHRSRSSRLSSNLQWRLLPANWALIGYRVISAGRNQRWRDTMQGKWLSCFLGSRNIGPIQICAWDWPAWIFIRVYRWVNYLGNAVEAS